MKSKYNQLIEDIYDDKFYQNYCNSLVTNRNNGNELFSEFLMTLLKIPGERLETLNERKELKYYLVTTIKNLIKYKYSSYNRLITNYDNKRVDEIFDIQQEDNNSTDGSETDVLLNEVEQLLNEIETQSQYGWYGVQLFRMHHHEGQTYRALAEETGISHTAIHSTVKKIESKIRKKLGQTYITITQN